MKPLDADLNRHNKAISSIFLKNGMYKLTSNFEKKDCAVGSATSSNNMSVFLFMAYFFSRPSIYILVYLFSLRKCFSRRRGNSNPENIAVAAASQK